MPLQNRVTPFGDLIATPERGTMMGNRGILHDDQQRIVRQSAGKRWLTCALEFRGRKLPVMEPHRYTKLFFLDEAAAFAAGHRPCSFCRNSDYRRFRNLWDARFGSTNVNLVDARLHVERLDGKHKRTYREDVAKLPDGTYVALRGEPYLVLGTELLRWTPGGYTDRFTRPAHRHVEVLTPPSIVALFRDGYHPVLHPSAID
jgi:hypothetical protein